MILVESVQHRLVERDPVYVSHHKPHPVVWNPDTKYPPPNMYATKEVVRGRKFFNSRGQVVVIGLTEEVEKILGLPFAALADQSNTINHLYRELHLVRKNLAATETRRKDFEKSVGISRRRIKEFLNLGIFGRIKFVFTRGVP